MVDETSRERSRFMSHASMIILWCLAILFASPSELRALNDAPVTDVVPTSYAFDFGTDRAWRKGGFRVVPYGAFWADMTYASERTNPGAFTFFVLSEEVQGEDAFTINARRSRFGFNAAGPVIPIDGGMQTGGQVEIDFQGEFVIENRAEVLLRHAYWEAKNARHLPS